MKIFAYTQAIYELPIDDKYSLHTVLVSIHEIYISRALTSPKVPGFLHPNLYSGLQQLTGLCLLLITIAQCTHELHSSAPSH